MNTTDLPALNAALNAASGVCLATGYFFIRNGEREKHRLAMLTAFGFSTLFLISYLTFHALHGSTPFRGTGFIRTVYFAILIPHVILAAAVPPLALVTLWRAHHEQFEAHRKIARITLPIWAYVSVTGVIIYFMVYQLYPISP